MMRVRCDKCNGHGNVKSTYTYVNVMRELLMQTPRSVWDAYYADGYSFHEAIKEELSYGDLP